MPRSTSDVWATLITFITGLPQRALIATTRSVVSAPWSCSRSMAPVASRSSSSESSGSTNRPVRMTPFGTRAPSAFSTSLEAQCRDLERRADHAIEAAGVRQRRQSQDLVRRIGIDAGRLEIGAIERRQHGNTQELGPRYVVL